MCVRVSAGKISPQIAMAAHTFSPAVDDLVNEGGIMDLWVREARLFKYGSGTSTNFSSLRGEGESLSGGGRSSGLMGFLKIGDRAAGAIKSGGTTRRAAMRPSRATRGSSVTSAASSEAVPSPQSNDSSGRLAAKSVPEGFQIA